MLIMLKTSSGLIKKFYSDQWKKTSHIHDVTTFFSDIVDNSLPKLTELEVIWTPSYSGPAVC